MSSIAKLRAALICAVSITALSDASFAQTGPIADDKRSFAVDEIIVTATRRQESLQSTPQSVSAVSADQIERLRARDAEDYALTVPGVSFTKQEGSRTAFVVRGIPSLGSAATTARYLDETPQSVDPRLFDIERVEVLRGPQGTLFGASSMGGAIRTITHKPDPNSFALRLDGSLSTVKSGGEGYDANVAINIPLIKDRLAVRTVAYKERTPGFIDNYRVISSPGTPPTLDARIKKNVGTEDSEGGRAMARWTPADTLSVDLAYYYQRTERDGSGSEDAELGKGGFRQSRPAGEIFIDEMHQSSLTVNYQLPFASLVSASSYAVSETDTRADVTNIAGGFLPLFSFLFAGGADTSGISPIVLGNDGKTKDFTQEVRLVSDSEKPFRWLVGGFYQNKKANGQQFQSAPGAFAVFGPLAEGDLLSEFSAHVRDEELSLFGEVSYNLTDKLQATVGLRRYHLENSFDRFQSGLLAFAGTLESMTEGTRTIARGSNKGFTYKALLSYEIDAEKLVYAQASSGYRAGGANSFVPETEVPTPQADYGSDKLWQYEIGWKSSWFDRHLIVNGAVFYIDWSDIQTSILTDGGYSFIGNAGKAHSKGVELEIHGRPSSRLNIGGSVSFVDAEFDSDFPTLDVVAGDRLPNIPKFSGNINARYNWPISNNVDGFVFSQYSRVGSRGAVANQPIKLDSYDKVDMRVGVSGNTWEAAVFARNIFDEKAIIGRFTNFAGERLTYLQPRTVGVALRFDF